MTTKSPEELAELRAQGPVFVKQYLEAETRNVFGHDVKFDKDGRPIEQGLGSPSQPTFNSYAATRKRESQGELEPGTTEAWLEEAWRNTPEQCKKAGIPRPARKAL